MKHGVVTGSALAALLAVGCAGSQKQATSEQQAAQKAEEHAQQAQEEAQKARESAQKANAEARKANQTAQQANEAQRQADLRAQQASHKAGVAEGQAAQAAAAPPPGARAPSEGAAERQGAGGAPSSKVVVITAGLLFESNKAELAPGATLKLNQVADAVKAQKTPQDVIVEGYTDDRGTAAHNEELSHRRAVAVASYLEMKGISKERISVKGLGESKPISTEKTPTGRQINRRVEIVVQPAPATQQQQHQQQR